MLFRSASFLASYDSEDIKEIAKKDASFGDLALLVGYTQKSKQRAQYLLPVWRLLGTAHYTAAIDACTAQAKARKVTPGTPWNAYLACRANITLLFHFLWHESGADVQKRTRAFTEDALKGRLKMRPFTKHFEGVDLAELERSYWIWVWKEFNRRDQKKRSDSDNFELFLTELMGEVQGAPGKPGQSPLVPATIRPKDLLSAVEGSDALLAMAIAAMRMGRSETADELLTQAIAGSMSDEETERLEREQARVQAWIALRDRFCEHLVTSGKKLNIEYEGKKLVAAVTKAERGVLTFASNKRGIETLAASELGTLPLARKMLEKKLGFEADWALAYAYVVAGDTKARRYLKGDEPERQSLAADFDDDYPERAEHVEIGLDLVAIATAQGTRDDRIQRLHNLWAKRYGVEYLAEVAPYLKSLARQALGEEFDARGITGILAGRYEELSDGRIRLRYDFDDRAQLADWPEFTMPTLFSEGFASPKTKENSLEVDNGCLSGIGSAARRHALAFEGPQRISWKERFFECEGSVDESIFIYEVGLFSDLKAKWVSMRNSVELEVHDQSKGHYELEDFGRDIANYETVQLAELVHDGAHNVALLHDGEETGSVECDGFSAGHPMMLVHSDYRVEILELEITGKPTAASLQGFRDDWVTGRLREMSFIK